MIGKTLLASISLWSKCVRINTLRTLIQTASNNYLTSYKQIHSLSPGLDKSSLVAKYSYNVSKVQKGDDEFKAKIILQFNFECTQDALPFYNLSIKTLARILKVTENDKKQGFCNNRLYFIASHIKCPPHILSEKLAKRTFVYSLSFDWLKKSLDVLVEMGVSGDRILRDLWVFKYHHETIRKRLTKVRDMGVDTLYPWMVRCSEDILNRSIQISQETKDILGDSKNTQMYLANRLNISTKEVEELSHKVPALKTIRVIKVKKFLDFLAAEGFTAEDIVKRPAVLSSSQKTVKKRLEKLQKYGLTEINLNVLCRCRKSFKRYCDSLERNHFSRIHNKHDVGEK